MSPDATTRTERAHRRQLKVVPVATDASDIERVIAAVERLEEAIDRVHELLESVIEVDETGARFIGVRQV